MIEHPRTQLPYVFPSAGAGLPLGHIRWASVCRGRSRSAVRPPRHGVHVLCGKKVDDDDLGLKKAMAAHSGNGRPLEDIRESVMPLTGRSDTEDGDRIGAPRPVTCAP